MTLRFLAMLGALAPAAAAGPTVEWASGPARVAVVELFTSEGCSSCPPAERWLAARVDDPGLWRDFVPVAWHVTYWDRLGWRDRFARPEFTRRQYDYAAAWHEDSVYTPCWVRNGTEWRPGADAAAGAPAGRLRVRYDAAAGALHVEYEPPADAGTAFAVEAVRLGCGIHSRIRAGENEGRELAHDFLALAAVQGGLVPGPGAWTAALNLPPGPDAEVPRQALAVWVTRRGSPTPLQAVGGWLEH